MKAILTPVTIITVHSLSLVLLLSSCSGITTARYAGRPAAGTMGDHGPLLWQDSHLEGSYGASAKLEFDQEKEMLLCLARITTARNQDGADIAFALSAEKAEELALAMQEWLDAKRRKQLIYDSIQDDGGRETFRLLLVNQVRDYDKHNDVQLFFQRVGESGVNIRLPLKEKELQGFRAALLRAVELEKSEVLADS